MRYLFLACLPLLPFAAACGNARAEGPDAGPVPMDVAGLAARLAAAEARIAALEARKVPHLVAPDGTDLGVALGSGAVAIPAGLDGPLIYSSTATLLFAMPGCMGPAWLSGTDGLVLSNQHRITPDGKVVRATGIVMPCHQRSFLESVNGAARCSSVEADAMCRAFVDTGMTAAPRSLETLRIELR